MRVICHLGVSKSEKKQKSGKQKEEKVKEVKPPKALNAYFFFSGEYLPKLKAEEGLSHREAMVRAGADWAKMSE